MGKIQVVKFDYRTWDKAKQKFISPDYVYIGREMRKYNIPESVLHNPYRINTLDAQDAHQERLRVLRLYDAYIDKNQAALNAVSALRTYLETHDLYLVCWCKGTQGEGVDVPCHGDIIKRRILQYDAPDQVIQEKLF